MYLYCLYSFVITKYTFQNTLACESRCIYFLYIIKIFTNKFYIINVINKIK